MILQRQHSLWKMTNIILIIGVLIMFISIIFFKFRIYSTNKDIGKKTIDVNSVINDITEQKNNENFIKFETAKVIFNKENRTNYVALYQYLNDIKNELFLTMGNEIGHKKFKMNVKEGEVNIDTMVYDYNYLYNNNTGGIFNILEKKDFITSIEVNSYETKNNMIYFKMKLKTK